MKLSENALTLEGFLRLPETNPASEFAEGRITRKVSPKGKHSVLQTKWAEKLNQCATSGRLGVALTELRCTFGGRSMVPDVAFFVWDRIPRDPSGEIADEFSLPPDLAIEILAPRQEGRELVEKLTFCVEKDGRLGWLVDPMTKCVTVFRPGVPPHVVSSGSLDASPVLPGVLFSMDEVFGWLIMPI